MAPRKRTTAKSRKNKPKMDKLDAFLHDFDSEVKTIIDRLKEKTKSLLKDADNLYNLAIIKLPKADRQLNWIEYSAPEGKTKAIAEAAKRELENADVANIVSEAQIVPQKSTKKASKRKGAVLSSAEEENISNNLSTTKKGRATAKKAPSTSKKARALSVSKQNSSIRKSTRKALVTPARSGLDSSLMGPTPLITPRFDSRLPKTPAVRNPRHKERVYSISVNGSPIAGVSNDILINVPLGNGESIQLLASEMESVDLSQLDEQAVQSIRLLQNRLANLCGK
ncbi:borealin [Amia ocellicauda]|uniref:borealin n=1 Tax=Amia ocellicauda TaxID=2972642 RepID=UPI0034648708|nr:BORE1 protein [Amia calva]